MKNLYDVLHNNSEVAIVCHTENEARECVRQLQSMKWEDHGDEELINAMNEWLLNESSAFGLIKDHGDVTFHFVDGSWDGYCWKGWFLRNENMEPEDYIEFSSLVSINLNINPTDVLDILER